MRIPFLNSLRFKVGFGYIVLVTINIAASAWTIYNFGRLTVSLNGVLSENFPNVLAAEKMASSVEMHESALTSFMNRDINNGKIKLLQAKDEYFQWYNMLSENRNDSEVGSVLDNMRLTYQGYLINIDTLQNFVDRGQFDRAKAYYANIIRPFSQNLSDNCFWLIEINQKQLQKLSRQAKTTSDETILAVLFSSFLAAVLSIMTMVQFTKRIIVPAERLTQTVNQIGRGQLDLKIDIATNDEIGQLSREFNKMTERLRKYEELNIDKIVAEKRKSEAIVENIADAIIVCDAAGRIELLNKTAEEILGVTEAEALGQPIEASIRDERIAGMLRASRPPEESSPYLQLTHNGRPVYVRPILSDVRTAAGERRGRVLILQDVTQFKELDKMKSDFMAAVSHEFRTPLTSITMGVDILRQQLIGPLTPQQEELLTASKQDCDRLTKLVRDLLQLSKLESGKIEFREEELDLRRVIASAIQPLLLPFKEKGVDLRVVVPDHLPKFLGDEQQFSWVVSNLVGNALRYTPGGGSVEIRAEVGANGFLVVGVRDTGRGIAPEHLKNIFDKFVQVKQAFDATPGSVGLGLSIAKEIIEAGGGRIWAESAPGKGSTFSFELPLARKETA